MEFGDFFDEGEAEAVSFSASFFAIRVKAFKGAVRGEIGNAGAFVTHGEVHRFTGGFRA